MAPRCSRSFLLKVYKASLCTCIVIGTLLAITGIALQFTFKPLLKQRIGEIFSFGGSSEIFGQQSVPSDDVFIKVYLFNVTNPNEVNKDLEKPYLQEVGPFVFREIKSVVLTEQDGESGKITYREKPTYFFQRNLSVGHPSEFKIYHVNAPDLYSNDIFYYDSDGHTPYSGGYDAGPFIASHTANQILYDGYDVEFYKKISYRPGRLIMMEGKNRKKYGLFYQRNNTLGKELTVSSGTTKDAQKLTEKIDYCNIKTVPCCTETQVCSSEIEETSKPVQIFNEDICKSRKFNYKDTFLIDNIQVYQYTGGEMREPDDKNISSGFHIEKCDHKGLKHLISSPHFHGESTSQSSVFGLAPNSKKHESLAYIEPITGFVLRKKITSQVNIKAKKLSSLLFRSKTEVHFFPMLWMNKEQHVDWQLMSEILHQVTYPMYYGTNGIYVVIGCGVFVVLVACAAWKLTRRIRLKLQIKENDVLPEIPENAPPYEPDNPPPYEPLVLRETISS